MYENKGMIYEAWLEDEDLIAESNNANEVTCKAMDIWQDEPSDSDTTIYVYKNGKRIYELDKHGWRMSRREQ
ncbi:MAG: hypothetical protein FWF59_02590 [Turicibacter sp.]|nr:hypothetical protein [Turicibacter sp.]